MSWVISKEIDLTSPEGFIEQVRSMDAGTQQEDLKKERDEQVGAAKNAAVALLACDVMQDHFKRVQLDLRGHANPGHKPPPGWSNDFIGLSIVVIE